MPLALDGQAYLCGDCEYRNLTRTDGPIRPKDFGLAVERDQVVGMGHRVLCAVFAPKDEVGTFALVIPVKGQTEVAVELVDEVAIREAVVGGFANCQKPKPDGSCGGVDTPKLAELLNDYSTGR